MIQLRPMEHSNDEMANDIVAEAQRAIMQNHYPEEYPATTEDATPTAPVSHIEIDESIIDEAVNNPTITPVEETPQEPNADDEYSSGVIDGTNTLNTANAQMEEAMHREHIEEEGINFEEETQDSPQEEETPEASETPEETPYENKVTIDIKDNVSRFRGAPWFDIVREQSVTLAGLGGIGSYVSFFLSRLQPKSMILYDADNVEFANLSGQLLKTEHIGQRKTDAAIDIARDFSSYKDIFSFETFFNEESEASRIMICGFDSMKSRKLYYEKWKLLVQNTNKEERKFCLFLDGRLSAEAMQVFCITGDDEKYMDIYEKEWLFSDEEAESTVCSYKQTTYCAAMIGSLMINLFVNFCTNLGEPDFPRDLPFFTTYEADMMYFKKER